MELSIMNREKAICDKCGEGFSHPGEVVGPIHINKVDKPHEWVLYHADCNPFKDVLISIQAKRAARLMEVRKYCHVCIEQRPRDRYLNDYNEGFLDAMIEILDMTKLPREVKDD